MIEVDAHVRIPLRSFNDSRVERGAPDRVDTLFGIDVVRSENGARSRACGMNHPAAHGDCVLQCFMREADLFERMNAPRRNRQINRSPADDVAFARVSAPLVEIDIVSAPAQVRGEQAARETGTDQNKFCLGHSTLSFRTCNTTENAQRSTFSAQRRISEGAENS